MANELAILGIIIFASLIALGIINYLTRRKKGKADYYTYFLIGITWLGTAVPMWFFANHESGYILLGLGIIFTAIGLYHKKDWKKQSCC